ncbi:hypothetical protein BH09PLA1_BH09PLA1_01710 [soil metagenome]
MTTRSYRRRHRNATSAAASSSTAVLGSGSLAANVWPSILGIGRYGADFGVVFADVERTRRCDTFEA